MSKNYFVGTIPKSYAKLRTLRFLLLDGNQLHGTIPEDFGDLENLVGLILSNNQLSGTISASLSHLKKLKHVKNLFKVKNKKMAFGNSKLFIAVPAILFTVWFVSSHLNDSAATVLLNEKLATATANLAKRDGELHAAQAKLAGVTANLAELDSKLQAAQASTSCQPVFPDFLTWKTHYSPQLEAAGRMNNFKTNHPNSFLKNLYATSLAQKVRGENLISQPEWPHLGDTMLKSASLQAIHDVIRDVAARKVQGHYLEAGVWRGGASIFARKIMDAYGLSDRHSFVCDSFEGLPPPRHADREPEDQVYRGISYLSVSLQDVQANFRAYCESDESKVHYFKGFFEDSMPKVREYLLRNRITLSVLRLDGDMYDSTIDILYNLYDLVEVGGYIIIDDFGWTSHEWKARDAIMDFRRNHEIEDQEHRFVSDANRHSAYFRKARATRLQSERYASTKAERATTREKIYPKTRITQEDYDKYRQQWEEWARTGPLIPPPND